MSTSDIQLVILARGESVPEKIEGVLSAPLQLSILLQTSDLSKAIKKLKELTPDQILVELSQIAEEKVAFLTKLKVSNPQAKIIAIAEEFSVMGWLSLLKAGARGVLEPGFSAGTLGEAILSVFHSGIFLAPSKVEKFVEQCAAKVKHVDEKAWDLLTDREIQILKLLAEGHTAKETARILELSSKTVDTHKANLMRKLNIHHRTDLIKYALRKKIISLNED